MTALPALQSPLRYISGHALDRYAERIDPSRDLRVPSDCEYVASALFRMYEASQPATLHQLRLLHVRADWEATYRISDTSAGAFLMIIKRNTLISLWEVGQL